MKTNEIIEDLQKEDWYNIDHLTEKGCADFVKSHYNCSNYVAKKVASEIVHWGRRAKSNFELGF